MKSIMQTNKECFVCGTTLGLHKHHIFFGTGNRRKSEEHGFTCWLCGYHHNMSNAGVHFNTELDLVLKQGCQRTYEAEHSREEFMRIIGRNYLDD